METNSAKDGLAGLKPTDSAVFIARLKRALITKLLVLTFFQSL